MATRERRSIAVFPYRASEPRFLLLKRIPEKGGFWQPVTGRVEEADGIVSGSVSHRHAGVIAGCRRISGVGESGEREHLLVAALREVEEETGVSDVVTVVDLGLESRFAGYDGVTYLERAFAAEVPDDAGVVLSWEHEDARWVTLEEALALLHWDENREALLRLDRFLA